MRLNFIALLSLATTAFAVLPIPPLPRDAIDLRNPMQKRQCGDGTICNGCRGCTIDGGCLGPCFPTQCKRTLGSVIGC
ncbi:hypothetical protein EXIGLDRAFT_724964 [Exidia glandulosa HHB12029]|uniref:Uncharacterized protein n=1 Tax=Exidia glandulosa HHB12029 TaxID=1314781 RepID=A0A165MMI1_EXIGL|nr:hypothetical protein EXIGLDRAFT_724964 [Exidia glandulosa HHB12029]